MSDALLRRAIKRAASEAPAAPWLEDRVMAAIAADAIRPEARSLRVPQLRRLSAVAAAVVAALIVGALVGSRLAGGGVTPAGAPSDDPAAVRLASTVTRDVSVIDYDYAHHFSCKTQAACGDELLQIEADTDALLADLSVTPAPGGESTAAQRLRVAAQRFAIELQAAYAAVQQPGSNFIAASGAPGIDNLDLAAAAVECWPLSAVVGDHGVVCSEG